MKRTKLTGVKIGIAALLAIVTLFTVFTMTACINKNKVDVAELKLDESTVPSMSVAGSFDVSQIKLICVDSEGNENEIFANGSMLTTESKAALNTPGEQHITLFYQGKTVTFTVLVVEEGTETVTVTFLDEKNAVLTKRTVIKGSAVTNLPTATSSNGLAFVGWEDSTGALVSFTSVTSNMTVSPKFSTTDDVFTVTFKDYDGNVIATQQVASGEKATAPKFVLPDIYSSISWPGIENPITRDTVFEMTAYFKSYTVSYYYVFENNLGVSYPITDEKGNNLIEVVEREKYPTLEDRAKSRMAQLNIEFDKWQSTAPSQTKITSDTRIIAIVKDSNFTITYKYDDGTSEDKFATSGELIIIKSDAPTKVGHRFLQYWEDEDGERYDVNSSIAVKKDLVLFPKYEKLKIEVLVRFQFVGLSDSGADGDVAMYRDKSDTSAEYQDKIGAEFMNKLLAEVKNDEIQAKDKMKNYLVDKIYYCKNDNDPYAENSEMTNITHDTIGLDTIKGGNDSYKFYVVLTDSTKLTEGLVFESASNGQSFIVKKDPDKDLDSENIYIPEKHENKPVTAIAANTFENAVIYSITIPSSVTTIGANAFKGATFHTDITLPVLTAMGADVFANAKTGTYTDENNLQVNKEIKVIFTDTTDKNAKKLTLPATTFAGSSGIKEVNLPSYVNAIGAASALPAANHIEKINLDNVEILGNYALANYVDLKTGGSTAKIKEVGNNAFSGSGLEELSLNGVTKLGNNLFTGMTHLKKLTISFKVGDKQSPMAGDLAVVDDCEALEEIVVGEGFASLTAVNTVILHSVKKLSLGKDFNAFTVPTASLPALISITVVSGNNVFFAQDDVLYKKVEGGYDLVFYPANKLGDFTVPEKVNNVAVTKISSNFSNANINNIVLDEKTLPLVTSMTGRVEYVTLNLKTELKSDGKEAFKNTVNTAINRFTTASKYYINVKTAAGVKIDAVIQENANWNSKVEVFDEKKGTTVKFDQTYRLYYTVGENGEATVIKGDNTQSSITVPASFGNTVVSAIATNAFVNYTNLVTLHVDAAIKTMSHVTGCTNLENLTIDAWHDEITSFKLEGLLDTNLLGKKNILVLGGVLVAYSPDPNNESTQKITREMLADTREIPAGIFSNAKYSERHTSFTTPNTIPIISIELPSTVVKIADYAFAGCTTLTAVDFGNVRTIGNYAFDGCTGLEKAIITDATSVGKGVFKGCTALNSVQFFKKINNGYVPFEAFYGCTSLATVNMPGVGYFSTSGGVSNAFAKCESLKDISFIKDFAIIARGAFFECKAIKLIDLFESNVQRIEQDAFKGCSGVTHIVISSTVTFIGEYAFAEISDLQSVEFKGAGGVFQVKNSDGTYGFELSSSVFSQSGNDNLYFCVADIVTDEVLNRVLKNYKDNNNVVRASYTVTFETISVFPAPGFARAPLHGVMYIESSPEAPNIEGYAFGGWFKNTGSEASPLYSLVEFPCNINADTKLYAKYYDIYKGSFNDTDMKYEENYNGEVGLNGYVITSCYRINGVAGHVDKFVYIPSQYTNEKKETYPVIAVDMAVFANWKGGELIFPEGIKYIYNSLYHANKAFDDESNQALRKGKNDIVNIELPSSIVGIEHYAFYNSPDLEVLTWDPAIDATRIERTAFANTVWYRNATAKARTGNGFVVIGNVAVEYFQGTEGVVRADVTIPADVTVLAKWLFGNPDPFKPTDFSLITDDKDIKSVILNEKLKRIGEGCFRHAPNLEVVDYGGNSAGENILIVEEGAFYGTKWYENQNSVIVGTIFTEHRALYGYSSVSVPAYVTEISGGYDYDGLLDKTQLYKGGAFLRSTAQEVSFYNNSKLQTIGDYAFQEAKLISITLPAITSLGKGAFKGCAGLVTADLSSVNIDRLPDGTFENCIGLSEVILSDTIKSIGKDAFKGCTNLRIVTANGVEISDGLDQCGIMETPFAKNPPTSIDADTFVLLGKILITYVPATGNAASGTTTVDGTVRKAVVIPGGVETIRDAIKGKGVFEGQSVINEVTIPDTVKTIGTNAFSGCSNLDKVSFVGDGLVTIKDNAFKDTGLLKNITFPTTLIEIGDSAFNGSGLTTVYIGDSVEQIGETAFENCVELESVTLGTGLKIMGEHAFYNCPNLFKVEWNWTTEVVETETVNASVYNYNAFDIFVKTLKEKLSVDSEGKSLNLSEAQLLDKYSKHISGLFDKLTDYWDNDATRYVRIYFPTDSYNYFIGDSQNRNPALKSYFTPWRDIKEDYIRVRKEGDYPTINFDGAGVDYIMSQMHAEVIEELPIPSSTGKTFVRWHLTNAEGPIFDLSTPQYIYKTTTLYPEWISNEIKESDVVDLGLGFRIEADRSVVTSISRKKNEDFIRYIPSTYGGKPVTFIEIDGDEALRAAEYVKTIVFTDAANFNGLTENIFRYFPNLASVTFLQQGEEECDMVMEDGAIYTTDMRTLVAYLVRYQERLVDGNIIITPLLNFVLPDSVETILPYAFEKVRREDYEVTIGAAKYSSNNIIDKNEEGEIVITKGDVIKVDATNTPSDLNIGWYSSNNGVVTVDSTGKVTAVGVGKAIVTATCGKAVDYILIKVVYPDADSYFHEQVTVDKMKVDEEFVLGDKILKLKEGLTLENNEIEYVVYGNAVTVYEEEGVTKVKAEGIGTSAIYIKYGLYPLSRTVMEITVVEDSDPATESTFVNEEMAVDYTIVIGETKELTVEADQGVEVEWFYDASVSIPVDENGIVSANAVGTGLIFAVYGDNVKIFRIEVVLGDESIETTDKVVSIMLGDERSISDLAVVSAPATSIINWVSSNTAVFTISEEGKIVAVAPGTALLIGTNGYAVDYFKVTVLDDLKKTVIPYLTEITISSGVKTIGNHAFNDSVDTLVFAQDIFITDATLESFENTVWYGSDAPKTNYQINGSSVGIFYSAANILFRYEWVSNITSLKIPTQLKGYTITVIASSIYNYYGTEKDANGNARGSKTINSLELPENLVKVNSGAFDRMNITNSIYAGNDLTDVADDAFTYYYRYNADSGEYETATMQLYETVDGVLSIGKVLVRYQNGGQEPVIIDDNIVSISKNAFNNCQATSIKLPSGLKYIGEMAFYGCPNLYSITIPASVTEICDNAFGNCQKLEDVRFEGGLNSRLVKIGNQAFSDCSLLKTISVPYTVEFIGDGAFMNCSSLTSVYFNYTEATLDANNVTYEKVIEKSRLKELGANAFNSCRNLLEISIPDGITVIKREAFANCGRLRSVTFDQKYSELKVIEEAAFKNCSSLGGTINLDKPDLITLELPFRLTTVGREAFANCTSLLGVSFNYNIKDIYEKAFEGCQYLTKVDMYASTEPTLHYVNGEGGPFDRGDNAYYRLRIYVNSYLGQTVLDRYRKSSSWVHYSSLLYERANADKPTLKYCIVINSKRVIIDPELSDTEAKDIIIDPSFKYSDNVALEPTNYTSWYYWTVTLKQYDVVDSSLQKKVVSVTAEEENRLKPDQNALRVLTQKDKDGAEHTILIVDYDEMVISTANLLEAQ